VGMKKIGKGAGLFLLIQKAGSFSCGPKGGRDLLRSIQAIGGQEIEGHLRRESKGGRVFHFRRRKNCRVRSRRGRDRYSTSDTEKKDQTRGEWKKGVGILFLFRRRGLD